MPTSLTMYAAIGREKRIKKLLLTTKLKDKYLA